MQGIEHSEKLLENLKELAVESIVSFKLLKSKLLPAIGEAHQVAPELANLDFSEIIKLSSEVAALVKAVSSALYAEVPQA